MAVDITQAASALSYTFFWQGANGAEETYGVTDPPFSILARVKLHAAPGSLGASIFKIERVPPGFGGSFEYYLLGIGSSLKPFIETRSQPFGGVADAISPDAIELDTWYDICAVVASDSSRKIYVSATLKEHNTDTVSPRPGGLEGIMIGASYTSTAGTYNRPLSACIQDVALYPSALSDADMVTYSGGSFPTAAHTRFPFTNEASALDVFDWDGATLTQLTDLNLNVVAADGGAIATCADSPAAPAPIETGTTECAEDFADDLQTAIDWPECVLVPSRISVDVVSPTVSPGRSFTGREQIVHPDAGSWRITFYDVPVRTRAHALQWREIETNLNGRSGVVSVPVYEGKLSDVAIVATALGNSIGESIIQLSQTAGEPIVAGMHFSDVGDRLYRVKRIIEQETGGGLTEIAVFPPLRAAIADGASLDFNTPRCRCRLATDDAMNINLELLRFGVASVSFMEDV